ncbi:DUF2281 domain-containing protein [Limnoraphis robusta]|uniref:DUF2281 domain-containing protein n=1 Tax=Limnoraphis robusta CCNP1315 TaxID=3110306 RepID=A0ABU5TZQ8_9CYAN|nr:DUF2281 domain-containing protein [Limnoraphis robusta]MEA5520421.1 DUF2281 domain-containing protein [Limnoraphis robusta CCNP1315]MEA5546940.1 DUF2281 domain-containing protein [Limnoraphis robusta CCNP1324]
MISTSTIIQAINQVLVNLSPEKQQEVLDFAEFLQAKSLQSGLVQPQKSSNWEPGFFEEVIGGWVGEPLERGEQVEKAVLVQELKTLFKRLQSLPEVGEITEEEIIAEINAYRLEK